MAQTKTIAIGCIAAVMLVDVIAACVIGGIFWLGLGGVAEKAENEGAQFGKRTDQLGCQTEALRRLRGAIKSNDLLKRREVELFLHGCFQTSRPTPDFCATAPKADEFLAVRDWSQEQCQKEGLGQDDVCVSLFMEVSDACLGKTKSK